MYPFNEGQYQKSQPRHYHPMNSEKICCLKHVIELCSFLKQQSRLSECGETLITFFQKYGLSMFSSVFSGDENHYDYQNKEQVFLLCNESASRYTVSGEMYKAHFLLDQAQAISQELPNQLKSSLFSNISCYYEKLNDDKTALLYLEKAIQFDQVADQEAPHHSNSPTRQISNAVNYNNLAVLDLKQMNFPSAQMNSKKAVVLIEPLVFAEINQHHKKEKLLRNDKNFLDRFQVMLVAYFNLGMSQSKVGNLQQATTVFEHGFKMAKKFLGEDHYFAQRFFRRFQKPLGNNHSTHPIRSYKQELGQQQEAVSDQVAAQRRPSQPETAKDQLNQSLRARQQQQQPQPQVSQQLQGRGNLQRDSSMGQIDSGKSSSGAQHSSLGRRDSKKRSEIQQVINDSRMMLETPGEEQKKKTQVIKFIMAVQREKEQDEEQLRQLKLLEEEMKNKQHQILKDQEEENKKLKELMLMLTQSQAELTKKQEEFFKKQEEFEQRMAQERGELIKYFLQDKFCDREKQRVKEEQEQSQRQREEEARRLVQEQRRLEQEKQFVKSEEVKSKEVQGFLHDAKEQLNKEREKFMQECQVMMKGFKESQEQQRQMMETQQREIAMQKQKLEDEKVKKAAQAVTASSILKPPVEEIKEDKQPPPEVRQNNTQPIVSTSEKAPSFPENKQSERRFPLSQQRQPEKGEEMKASVPQKQPEVKKAEMQTPSDENQSLIKSGNYSMTDQKKGSSDERQGSGGTQAVKSGDNQHSSLIGSGKENNPLQNISQSHYSFTNEQLDDIIKEDYELYDASIILQNEDFKKQLEQTKLVSQIIYSQGYYFKIYCEGFLSPDDKNKMQPCFRFFGSCTDPNIQITEEKLDFLEIKSLLKLMQVRDAMPPVLPLRHIRTFEQLCGHYLLPYIIINNGQGTPGTNEDNNNQIENFPAKGERTGDMTSGSTASLRQIEYWGRPPGFFKEEVHIYFLRNACNVGLHYIDDFYFRVSLFSLEADAALNPIYLDVLFDEQSFQKYFELIDSSNFSEDNQTFQVRLGETMLKSIKIVEKAFINELVPGLQAFENFLEKEFGADAQFNFLAFERSHLIYQLKIKDEGTKQELWCVKDEGPQQQLRVSCQTLYELRIKKRVKEKVEKTFLIKYDQFWNHFGVQKKDLDRSQLIMCSVMLLNSLFLHMPTMEINKGDQEDSDYEEEINITQKKIEPVESFRKIIEMQGEKVILTIYLLGYEKTFLGVKVAIYNSALIKDLGFFFTVDQKYWEAEEHERVRVSKRRQEYLRDNYYLDEFLRKFGFQSIINKIIMNQQEKSIQWQGPYGKTSIDVFESYFTRNKY